MKKRVLNIIAIILTISIIFELYVFYNGSKDNNVLEEIQISENIKGSKQIAIKQQKTDWSWEDIGTNLEEWPSQEDFEYYGSECTDATGKAIIPATDVIQFDFNDWKATISTSKTIYCTLSFARRSTVLKLMQKTTTSDYLKTVAENDELLRYVGTQDDVTSNKLNNFICFGTENKDTCLNNKDTYMYRIIGITTEDVNQELGLVKDQIKIIKAVPPSDGTSIKWAGNNSSNIDWDNRFATARVYLNETFLNGITGTVGTHQWSDLITSPQWYIGDNGTSGGSTFKDTTERNPKTISSNYKIGLMYASDYHNSFNYANQYKTTNSWLHIINGMTGSASTYSKTLEWAMTREGGSTYYLAWFVHTSGYLNAEYQDKTYAVRPVFYLQSEISMSGEGTESNPFIISDRITE